MCVCEHVYVCVPAESIQCYLLYVYGCGADHLVLGDHDQLGSSSLRKILSSVINCL